MKPRWMSTTRRLVAVAVARLVRLFFIPLAGSRRDRRSQLLSRIRDLNQASTREGQIERPSLEDHERIACLDASEETPPELWDHEIRRTWGLVPPGRLLTPALPQDRLSGRASQSVEPIGSQSTPSGVGIYRCLSSENSLTNVRAHAHLLAGASVGHGVRL